MSTSLTIIDEEAGFEQSPQSSSPTDFLFDPSAVFHSLLGLDHEPVTVGPVIAPCWEDQAGISQLAYPVAVTTTPPFSDPSFSSSSCSPESTPPNPPSSPDSVFLRPTDQEAKLHDDDEESKFKRAQIAPPPVVKDPAAVAAVRLPREELVHMSRAEIKEYAQMKAKERPLTQAEQQELQRQMRAVRNRESAQLSRKRKREQIDSLTEQVNALTNDNDKLRNENALLLEQLEQLRSSNSSESVSISRRTQVGAGSALFMVILFTFGFWFYLNPAMGNSFQPYHSTTGGHILSAGSVPNDYTNHPAASRTILEIPFVNVVDASEDDETDLLKHEYNTVIPAPQQEISPSEQNKGSWRAKNMTYFVSEHLTRVDPPWAEPGDNHLQNDDHPFFAVIMPESAFTGPAPTGDFTPYDFVEVICGLVAVNIIPRGLMPPLANV